MPVAAGALSVQLPAMLRAAADGSSADRAASHVGTAIASANIRRVESLPSNAVSASQPPIEYRPRLVDALLDE
jgi:hypothetical protein